MITVMQTLCKIAAAKLPDNVKSNSHEAAPQIRVRVRVGARIRVRGEG